MGREIEIKFMAQAAGAVPGADPDWDYGFGLPDGAAFAAALGEILTGLGAEFAGPELLELENHYYDTPDLELCRRGVALRVRRCGGKAEATVKTGPLARGGLHVHPEYNVALDAVPEVPDLGLFPAEIFREIDTASAQSRLAENMSQRCTRRVWTVRIGEGAVEISFDRVRYLTADGAGAENCELELELKEGGPGALEDLAIRVAAAVRARGAAELRPESLSKMHRASVYAGLSALAPATLAGEAAAAGVADAGKAPAAVLLPLVAAVVSKNLSLLYLGRSGRSRADAEAALAGIREALARFDALDLAGAPGCAALREAGRRAADARALLDPATPYAARAAELNRLFNDAEVVKLLLKENFRKMREASA